MKIIYQDNHLLVVQKPNNVPTAKDESDDLDLLTMAKAYIKETYNKPNDVYLGLVHRLDRPVSGVMVFARTSKAASRLSKQISEHTFRKTYLAVVCGKPTQLEGNWIDYLIKDEKTNTSKVTNKDVGKLASLDYQVLETKDDLSLLKINLHTGRSHQIRVQTSSRNLPIWGDQRYNKKAQVGQQIALHAYSISFQHPTTKEELSFSCLPDNPIFKQFDSIKEL